MRLKRPVHLQRHYFPIRKASHPQYLDCKDFAYSLGWDEPYRDVNLKEEWVFEYQSAYLSPRCCCPFSEKEFHSLKTILQFLSRFDLQPLKKTPVELN